MVESSPQELYETMSITNETGGLTKDFDRRVKSQNSFEQWEDFQTTVTQERSKIEKGIRHDTSNRRCAIPMPALAKEGLEKCSINESQQLPSEAEDKTLKHYRQRYFITNSPTAPNTSIESKECCVQKTLESHRLQCDDQCGLLERRKNISSQPHISLICKYVNCDKFQGYTKEKKENHREMLKLEKEQTKANTRVVGDDFMSDEDMMSSSGIKKRYIPKSVNFYVPGLATINNLDALMMDSSEVGSHKKSIRGNQVITLESGMHSSSETRSEEAKLSSAKQDLGRKKWVRECEVKQKNKMKTKGPDILTVKLNLHPFRKVRIHPQKSFCSEKPQQKPDHQHKEPPNDSKKKLSHASNKELKRKKRKSNQGFSAVPQVQQSTREERKIYSKNVAMQFFDKQTSAMSKNAKSATIITSADAAELSEEKCNNPIVSVPPPFENISNARNSKGLTSPVPAEAVMYNENLLLPSTKETSKTVIPTISLATQNSVNTSQNGANDISIPLNSREVNAKDTGATDSRVYQNSQMTTRKQKGLHSSSGLTAQTQITGNLENKNANSECVLGLRSVMQNTVKNVSHGQMENQVLKSQNENLNMIERLESCEKVKECESLEEKLLAVESYTITAIPQIPPDSHSIAPETCFVPKPSNTDSSNHSTSLLQYTETNKHLTIRSKEGADNTDNLHGTVHMEDGVKIEQREYKQPSNDSELLSEVLIPGTQVNLDGISEVIPQTQNDVANERCKLFCTSTVKVSIMSNTSSIPSSPKTRNMLPCSNISFQINNNMHMENVQNLQHVQNNQSDEDNNTHEEGEMALEEYKEPFVLSELKDISSEAENEASLIPSRINDAENSAPEATLYPPSAECANTSPLEAEQSDENNSNNNHIPLLLASKQQTSKPSLSENSLL
ncbi:leucine-rich repeat-containing protein 53 [Carettochelys insculpta]|uniref:leucine-rich repeat-containing protein 53 n=1 Tax=Carettochelys insculpta TaxID=44489 RepID=UPI003EB8C4B2